MKALSEWVDADDVAGAGCYLVLMLSTRHQTALHMREAGSTYEAIGEVMGVSAARVRAIYKRACVLRLEQDAGLSIRSIRIVRNLQQTPSELATMLDLDRDATFVALLREPNCNRRHAEEIIAWLEEGSRALPEAAA